MVSLPLLAAVPVAHAFRGGVSEWLKEAVLKTVVPKGTVGSNPTASARIAKTPYRGSFSCPASLLPEMYDATRHIGILGQKSSSTTP